MSSNFEKIEKSNKAKVTLADDSVVIGTSWGIIDAEDDDGESLGYELLIFNTETSKNPLSLREEDIKLVESL